MRKEFIKILRAYGFTPVYVVATVFIITTLMTGCSQKAVHEGSSHPNEIVATVTEIDEHGNIVTNIPHGRFEGFGWQLGDTLEIEFATGQKIRCKHVKNYEDVPAGDFLARFSSTRGLLKIAINKGNIAQALRLEGSGKVVIRKVL